MSSRLKVNISWLAIIKVTNALLPLLTLPYLTSVLGVELFGVIAIGMAIQQVAFSVCDYGFGVYAPKLVAEDSTNLHRLGQLMSAINLVKLTLFFISSLIIFIVLTIIDIPEQYKTVWLLMLISPFLQCLIPNWFFLGIERMANITLITVLERAIYTVLIFSFINSQENIILIPVIMAFSMAVAFFCSLVLVLRFKVKPQRFSSQMLLQLIIDGWGYFYSRITMILFSKFNVIIVGSVLGEASAGFFSLAERIYNAARSVVSPLTDALYPHMVKTKNWKLARKIIKFSSIGSFALLIFSFLVADWFFIHLFGSEEYQQSAQIFNILMVAFTFSVISMLIGYPVLGAIGYANKVNRSVLYGAVSHLFVITLLWLTNNLSGTSLAYSLVATEFIIFSYRMLYLYQSEEFWLSGKTALENGNNS